MFLILRSLCTESCECLMILTYPRLFFHLWQFIAEIYTFRITWKINNNKRAWSITPWNSGPTLARIFRIGYSKIHILGELGVQLLFHPIALYTKNMDIRMSKISNRETPFRRHPPLANGLVKLTIGIIRMFTESSRHCHCVYTCKCNKIGLSSLCIATVFVPKVESGEWGYVPKVELREQRVYFVC